MGPAQGFHTFGKRNHEGDNGWSRDGHRHDPMERVGAACLIILRIRCFCRYTRLDLGNRVRTEAEAALSLSTIKPNCHANVERCLWSHVALPFQAEHLLGRRSAIETDGATRRAARDMYERTKGHF